MLEIQKETAGQSAGVVGERVPAAPRRDADGRREPSLDPGVCGYCRRHPRRGLGGRGRTADFCDQVWAVDEKGRDVTCARLDEADQVTHAAYGGAVPGFDLAGLGRDIGRALAEVTPLQRSLIALDKRLDDEVAAAHDRAETAEHAREEAETRATAAEVRAEAARAAADEAADRAEHADARAAEAERRAAADRQQAQQAHADRIAALGKAEALQEQIERRTEAAERAAERIEELTAHVSARTGEAEAAHARARDVENDLRELSERHMSEVVQLRDRHDQALTDLRARDHDDRERLRAQLQVEHDQRLTDLRREHEAALAAARQETADLAGAQVRAETTADAARANATEAARERDSVSARMAALREGVLTALAGPLSDLPDRLHTLLDTPRSGG
ncbi:hypothetical protein [Amycolatopsis sp. GM8]|uniref:hypothetical protein n=1 Tax=Amycolatopsis sp. GM8 TaxID=2896530 RepID=UPI001F29BBBA|nr:hypothetical protein [Amycolatopsis sp. GM8]